MAEIVYILCALSSILCALMLFRQYLKARTKLLLWSCASFCFLALNNIVLVIDVVLLPDIEFGGIIVRSLLSACSGAILLFGLIWEVT